MEMDEKAARTHQRVAAQVAALRGRLDELGELRGVAFEVSDRVCFAEVLGALDRLDVEPGEFFDQFWRDLETAPAEP